MCQGCGIIHWQKMQAFFSVSNSYMVSCFSKCFFDSHLWEMDSHLRMIQVLLFVFELPEWQPRDTAVFTIFVFNMIKELLQKCSGSQKQLIFS